MFDLQTILTLARSTGGGAVELRAELYDTDPDLLEGRPFDDETPDLPPTGPALYIASSSNAMMATPSDADVTLATIHNDIQLMHFTILAIFCMVFVYVMIVRRFK